MEACGLCFGKDVTIVLDWEGKQFTLLGATIIEGKGQSATV